MEYNRKLPVFKMKINPADTSQQEISYIALVDVPAIEINWMAFDKHYKFIADNDRRIVTGPLMVADMPIYRRGIIPFTEQEGEFYTVFDKEAIQLMAEKFFRNHKTSEFNLMHSGEHRIKDVYLFESILVDKTRGIRPPVAFEGIADGSWIASVKIDNEIVWQEYIKTGTLKGFSVEGMFSPVPAGEENEDVLDILFSIVNN